MWDRKTEGGFPDLKELVGVPVSVSPIDALNMLD
jgi:predicted Rdx family selenoprotein